MPPTIYRHRKGDISKLHLQRFFLITYLMPVGRDKVRKARRPDRDFTSQRSHSRWQASVHKAIHNIAWNAEPIQMLTRKKTARSSLRNRC